MANPPREFLFKTLDHSFEFVNLFVHSAAFSPDETLLCSAYHRTVFFWNIESGKIVHEIPEQDEIGHVSFSPDGSFVCWTDAEKVCMWEVQIGEVDPEGKKIKKFLGHTGSVRSVSFSPDGKLLCSGSTDNTVRLWNTETGDLVRTFISHTEGYNPEVKSVSFFPDGRSVCATTKNCTVQCWNIQTGDVVWNLNVGPQYTSLHEVSVSPDGATFCFGIDNKIMQWNTNTERPTLKWTCILPSEDTTIFSVSFSPDGKFLCSGANDGNVRLHNSETGEIVNTFEYNGEINSRYFYGMSISQVRFSSKGTFICSVIRDTVQIWKNPKMFREKNNERFFPQHLNGTISRITGHQLPNDVVGIISGFFSLEDARQVRL
jgi:WD40 repeat protein